MTSEDAIGVGRPSAPDGLGGTRAGWWPSPWSAAEVAAGKVSRGGLQADRGGVYWTESRPDEGGRQVVVGAEPGARGSSDRRDVSPPGVSVRSRVHEYGGGSATMADGILFYVDQDDQDWYRWDPASGDAAIRLTSTGGPEVRHADGHTTTDGRWLVSVEERVTGPSATHQVVATPTDGSGGSVVLVDHGHFVAAPRPSPDGRWLAWCTWDHPDMPWDATVLRVAPLDTGAPAVRLDAPVDVAGGPGVSVGQPRWTADGGLVFVDDRSGWWLPYRVAPGALEGMMAGSAGPDAVSTPLVEVDAEFHGPDWVLGLHTFDELADGALVARMGTGGRDRLVVLRPPSGGPDSGRWSMAEVAQPCVSLAGVVSPDGVSVVICGTTPTESHAVFAVASDGTTPPRRLSAPPAVVVTTERASHSRPHRATVGDHTVPGLFFPPTNPDAVADPGYLPPLVVFCHGGPTAAAEPGYDPTIQFLTSRGIAVAAVDYRGSTGYGRAYRDLLRGTWGEGDVDDCVAYAQSLAAEGRVDGSRMAIRGGSAGGLTALAALIRARVFAGAVAWYGVTDLLALATDTHDFESRYLDRLVGPLPEAADIYRERSPIHHAADLVGRVLLLQGADDPIVPLDQAERFAAELASGGSDAELLVFEGESHGFRRAATIEACLEAELGFYRALFAPSGTVGA
jgi:dipeptidyl aminopeptidase/acylaminoacyl peptidase